MNLSSRNPTDRNKSTDRNESVESVIKVMLQQSYIVAIIPSQT